MTFIQIQIKNVITRVWDDGIFDWALFFPNKKDLKKTSIFCEADLNEGVCSQP